jgi:hypothetical protein
LVLGFAVADRRREDSGNRRSLAGNTEHKLENAFAGKVSTVKQAERSFRNRSMTTVDSNGTEAYKARLELRLTVKDDVI